MVVGIADATADVLHDHIVRLIAPGTPQRTAAREVAAEMREQPSPSKVAAALETLTGPVLNRP